MLSSQAAAARPSHGDTASSMSHGSAVLSAAPPCHPPPAVSLALAASLGHFSVVLPSRPPSMRLSHSVALPQQMSLLLRLMVKMT